MAGRIIMKNHAQAVLVLNLAKTLRLKMGKFSLVALVALAVGGAGASAATVTLRGDDAASTTSFTGSTNWNPTGAPASGNNYFTGAHVIRSVNNTSTGKTNTFAGD